jgi:hypothetical protein
MEAQRIGDCREQVDVRAVKQDGCLWSHGF